MNFKRVGWSLVLVGLMVFGFSGLSWMSSEEQLKRMPFDPAQALRSIGITPTREVAGADGRRERASQLVASQNASVAGMLGGGFVGAVGGGILIYDHRRIRASGKENSDSVQPPSTPESNELANRLRELDGLRQDGLLSADEFEVERKKLLEKP